MHAARDSSTGPSSPTRRSRAYYDDKFGKYRELYQTLRPFNAGY